MSDAVVLPAPVLDPTPTQVRAAANRDLWLDRFRRFASSGQSVTDFCRTEGIAKQAFYYWRNRLARPDHDTVNDQPRFVPVRLRAEATPVELVLPTGAVLRLSPGCDL